MENIDPPQKPTADDLQDQTGEIADSARKTMADIDKEFNNKIDDLGTRVTNARGRAKQFEPESNNFSGMSTEDAKGLGTGLTAAYSLIGTPILLYLVGLAIDRIGNRGADAIQFAPILGFVGFLLGLFFTIIVANRHN